MHRRLERVALKPEPIAEVESRDAASGAAMTWKRTRAATDHTRGVRLFFPGTGWRAPALGGVRRRRRSSASITSWSRPRIPNARPRSMARGSGSTWRSTASHQDWGQLMFFRCGDLIVEVVRRPVAGGDADARQTVGPELAGRRHRRGAGAAGGRRPRRLGGAHRPQARHAGDERAQRHLRRADAVAGADGARLAAWTEPLPACYAGHANENNNPLEQTE